MLQGPDEHGLVVLRPTRGEAARRDRLLWRLSRETGPAVLRLEPPAPGDPDPADAEGLFLLALDLTRWRQRGWLKARVELSDALPGGLARLFPFPTVRTATPPPPGAPPPDPRTARLLVEVARSAPLTQLNPEWVALDLGLRRVVRLIEDPADLAERHGLPWAVVPQAVDDRPGGRLDTGCDKTRRMVYAGPDAALNEHLAALEGRCLAGELPGSAVHAELGAALGYPECCVQAYLQDARGYEGRALPAFGVNPLHFQAMAARTRGAPHFLLNPFLRDPWLRPLAHFPCRFDCPASLSLAQAVVREMHRRAPAVARALPAYLKCVALVFPDREEALFVGRPGGDGAWLVGQVLQPGSLGQALYAADRLTPALDALVLDFRGV